MWSNIAWFNLVDKENITWNNTAEFGINISGMQEMLQNKLKFKFQILEFSRHMSDVLTADKNDSTWAHNWHLVCASLLHKHLISQRLLLDSSIQISAAMCDFNFFF
jgi:hypothetical protein